MMKPKKIIKSLIVLGDNGVGKTTILYNFSKNKEMNTTYRETIGKYTYSIKITINLII